MQSTQNIFVWWQVTMDVERWKNCDFGGCTFNSNGCPIPNGSYYCTTTYLACQNNQPSGYASSGGPPFRLLLAKGGGSAQAQDLLLTLRFAGGAGIYRLPLRLAGGAMEMVDLAALIRRQQPDAEGHVIPLDVAQGSAVISGPKSVADEIEVVSSASVFNVTRATCDGICQTCAGFTGLSISPDPLDAPAGPDGNTLVDSISQTWCSGFTFSNSYGIVSCNAVRLQSDTIKRYRDHGAVTIP